MSSIDPVFASSWGSYTPALELSPPKASQMRHDCLAPMAAWRNPIEATGVRCGSESNVGPPVQEESCRHTSSKTSTVHPQLPEIGLCGGKNPTIGTQRRRAAVAPPVTENHLFPKHLSSGEADNATEYADSGPESLDRNDCGSPISSQTKAFESSDGGRGGPVIAPALKIDVIKPLKKFFTIGLSAPPPRLWIRLEDNADEHQG